MSEIRHDGTVGLIEYEAWGADKKYYLHFSEWWNGEGMDYTFSIGNDERKISLHIDDIHTLVVSAIASDFVNIEKCIKQAEELKRTSEERNRRIQEFAGNI